MRKLLLSVILLMVPLSAWAWTTTNHFDTETTGDGWYTWRSGYGGIVGITGTQSAPGSPSNSLQITEPAGFPDSGVPGGASFVFPSPTNEFWMQYYFKYSSDFQFHTVANKQLYIWYADGTMSTAITVDDPNNPHFSAIMLNSAGVLTSNTGNNPTIQRNRWYKVVFHVKMVGPGQDTFQLWVDDQLVWDYNNATAGPHYNSSFGKVAIDPVWGGQASPPVNVASTQYQWYDYAIVSTNPLVAGIGITGGNKIASLPKPPGKLKIQ